MSIVRPCPYDENRELCKYEIYYGEPNFSKCKNCSRIVHKRGGEMTEEEKQELEYMEFDYNGLHFECYKGGLLVTKNGEKVGQCFDVFTKFMPPKEDIIKFWEALIKMSKE